MRPLDFVVTYKLKSAVLLSPDFPPEYCDVPSLNDTSGFLRMIDLYFQELLISLCR